MLPAVKPRGARGLEQLSGNTLLDKILRLSDHLEVRSPTQQGPNEAPEIDLMFDKDDTDPRREIFPSTLFGLWYRNL